MAIDLDCQSSSSSSPSFGGSGSGTLAAMATLDALTPCPVYGIAGVGLRRRVSIASDASVVKTSLATVGVKSWTLALAVSEPFASSPEGRVLVAAALPGAAAGSSRKH